MYGTSTRLQGYKTTIVILACLAVLAGIALVVVTFATGGAYAADGAMAVAGGACILVGLMLMLVVLVLAKVESNTYRVHNQLLDIQEMFNRHFELMAKIAENTAISDAAKSLTNRHHEWEAVQSAVAVDVRAERWDAALHLLDGLEGRFGPTAEVATLRDDVVHARSQALRRRFEQASKAIEDLIDQYAWDKAQHEIDRLHHALPNEPRVGLLRNQLTERKAERKSALLAKWQNAISREDVDESIRVLGELDPYLSRDEAKALEDPARSIFRAKLMQLGMQFRFAVKEQRWRDALEIGLQITDEFPNSRMSQEVTEALDGLRRRAGVHSDVEITTTGDRAHTAR